MSMEQFYELTEPQKRIWITQEMYPDSSLYNIGGYVLFQGNVDLNLLKEVIRLCILKISALRIKIIQRDGRYQQYFEKISNPLIRQLSFYDYSHGCEAFEQWCKNELSIPFTLEDHFLFDFAVAGIKEGLNGYFIKLHHVIADGWSIQILTDKVIKQYELLSNNIQEPANEEQIIDYKEFILSERDYIASNRFKKNQLFWKNKLLDIPKRMYEFSKELEGKRKRFLIDLEQSDKIHDFCNANHISINTLFVLLYFILQYSRTNRKKQIVGVPFLGRRNRREKELFGMMVNSIPFPFLISEKESIFDMAGRIDLELGRCIINSQYSYSSMWREATGINRQPEGMFNSCINYYNTKIVNEYNGIKIVNKELYCGQQDYSLQIIIRDWLEGTLQIEFDYKLSLFTEWDVENLYEHLMQLLSYVLDNKSLTVIECLEQLRSMEEKHLLYDFNNTAIIEKEEKTVVNLFLQQALFNPSSYAVIDGENKTTYAELANKVCSMTSLLRSEGVGKNQIVAVMAGHSTEVIISILAILRAGGAFLTIDPRYPVSRKSYMLKDSNVKLVLSDLQKIEPELSFVKHIDIHDDKNYKKGADVMDAPDITMDDLAYVLYTSGTSGRPKGVMTSHGGLARYHNFAKRTYVQDKSGDFALFTSISFDLTLTSVFTPLITGHAVIIYWDENNQYVLNRIIEDNHANIIKVTPTHLSLLETGEVSNQSIRTIIVGGEQLTSKLAKRIYTIFGERVVIYNEYGPTEAVVGCMIYRFNPNKDYGGVVPIGKPADNVRIYLLDEQRKPVPLNTPGELYVWSKYLSKGYLGMSDLTAEKFVDSPFALGEKMYKTGDIAKFISYDCIQFIGREDEQIKLNGYRIELDEIKYYLQKHRAIQDGFVCVYRDKNHMPYICGYYVTNESISEKELKAFLLKYLPQYMLPEYLFRIESLPVTLSGKVDLSQLPRPAIEYNSSFLELQGYERKIDVLSSILRDILSVDSINESSDFYQLGGDSIKAIFLATKVSNYGFRLKAGDILSNPMVKHMAKMMESTKLREDINCIGDIQATPMLAYFHSLELSNINHYNQSVMLSSMCRINREELIKAFEFIIRYNDSLRINYSFEKKVLFYNDIYFNQGFKVLEYDVCPVRESDREIFIKNICSDMKKSFQIEHSLLMKVCLFIISESETLIFITAHHFIVDGISWSILINDLDTLLAQMKREKELQLPQRTTSYQQWAEYINNRREGIVPWKVNSVGVIKETMQNLDYGKYKITHFNLEKEILETILQIVKQNRDVSEVELFILSIIEAIRKTLGIPELTMDMEWHGREDDHSSIDLSKTIGWFTSIVPIYIAPPSSGLKDLFQYYREQIGKVRQYARNYEMVFHYCKYKNQRNSLVKFNYLGNYDHIFHGSGFRYADIDTGPDVSIAN